MLAISLAAVLPAFAVILTGLSIYFLRKQASRHVHVVDDELPPSKSIKLRDDEVNELMREATEDIIMDIGLMRLYEAAQTSAPIADADEQVVMRDPLRVDDEPAAGAQEEDGASSYRSAITLELNDNNTPRGSHHSSIAWVSNMMEVFNPNQGSTRLSDAGAYSHNGTARTSRNLEQDEPC